MRVDTLGHTFKAVSEDELDDGAIDIGRVKHTSKRVAALMRCMRHAEVVHDRVKDSAAERVVAVTASICASADVEPGSLHSLLVPWHELTRDGDKPARTGIGLAVPDHDDATAQLDVGLTDVTVFADTTAGVDEHEYVAGFGYLVDATPEFVALPDSKRLFLMQLLGPINIKVARIVFDDEVVPQGILVKLLEQRADFLLRRVSAAGMAHVINDLVKVPEPNVYENHRMEAGAMLIRVAVADACSFASETRKVLGFPQCVDLSKSGLARAQQGRVAIVLDQVRHRVLKGLEVPQGFLSVLDSLLDDIRPPPFPL